MLVLGWGVAQYPYLVYPDLPFDSTAAPVATLRFVVLSVPVGALFIVPSLWTLLRAGPLGWWRASATLVASEGSLLARIRLLLLMFVGAELAWLARRKGWTHVHVHSCGNWTGPSARVTVASFAWAIFRVLM